MRDNQRVGELYDQFVTGRIDSLDEVLPQAWGPGQTREMHDALVRLREFNAGHRDDPVRVIGSSRVLVADYDRVLEVVPAARVKALFEVIRVAHANGEHVQRAHPGTPFVELAREAAEIASGAGPEAQELMAAIVAHHGNAIGVGYGAKGDDEESAGRLLDLPGKVVLWEGSAHVAAQFPLGARLRAQMGDACRAVHVTFGSGSVAGVSVPEPVAGSLEGALHAAGPVTRLLDLRSSDWIEPARIRLISGLHDPAHDEDHYYELPSLKASFDAVAYFPEVTSTSRFLPSAVR